MKSYDGCQEISIVTINKKNNNQFQTQLHAHPCPTLSLGQFQTQTNDNTQVQTLNRLYDSNFCLYFTHNFSYVLVNQVRELGL